MRTEIISETAETSEFETEDTSIEVEAVDSLSELSETVTDLASELQITNYTAPASNINHGHKPDKHDVRSAFGVEDDFIRDHFVSIPNDHAALWELSYRKDEFMNSDDALFKNHPNDHEATWASIERRKTSAPIPSETHSMLKSL